MEGVGKGNKKEAALGETLVAPLYKPPQPECLFSVAFATLCTAGPVEVILAASWTLDLIRAMLAAK